jgi:hypothetical protein
MFSARSAAVDAEYPLPGPAAGKIAAIETFIQYSAFKVHVTCAAFKAQVICAAFPAAGG